MMLIKRLAFMLSVILAAQPAASALAAGQIGGAVSAPDSAAHEGLKEDTRYSGELLPAGDEDTVSFPNLWTDGIEEQEIPANVEDNATSYSSGLQSTVYKDSSGLLVFIKGASYDASTWWGSSTVVPSDRKFFKINKKGILKAKAATGHTYLIIDGEEVECAIVNPKINGWTSDTEYRVGESRGVSLKTGMLPTIDTMGAHVTWQSSDSNVAFVSDNKIYMAGEGNATIKASLGGMNYSRNVKVRASSQLSNRIVFLRVGQKATIYLVKKDSEDNYERKKCSSLYPADPSIAETGDGTIIGAAPGTTTVQAVYTTSSSKDTTKEEIITVYVSSKEFIEDDFLVKTKEKKNKYDYTLSISTGQKYTLNMPGLYPQMRQLVWKASKKSKSTAIVNEYGCFYGLSAGTARYTTTSGGIKYRIDVNVSASEYDNELNGNKVVSFTTSYGTNPPMQLVKAGNPALLPIAPLPSSSQGGYLIFDGWETPDGSLYEEAEFDVSANVPERYFKEEISTGLSLTARWDVYSNGSDVSTVHFMTHDGSSFVDSRSFYTGLGGKINVGQLPRLEPTLEQSNIGATGTGSMYTADDYVFRGWYTSQTEGQGTRFDLLNDTVDTSTLYLYPRYTYSEDFEVDGVTWHTVTVYDEDRETILCKFEVEDGKSLSAEQLSELYAEQQNIDSTLKTFLNWAYQNSSDPDDISVFNETGSITQSYKIFRNTEDKSVNLVFNIVVYDVSGNATGESSSLGMSLTAKTTSKIFENNDNNVPEPSDTKNYIFEGWYLALSENHIDYSLPVDSDTRLIDHLDNESIKSQVIAGQVNLYAKFREKTLNDLSVYTLNLYDVFGAINHTILVYDGMSISDRSTKALRGTTDIRNKDVYSDTSQNSITVSSDYFPSENLVIVEEGTEPSDYPHTNDTIFIDADSVSEDGSFTANYLVDNFWYELKSDDGYIAENRYHEQLGTGYILDGWSTSPHSESSGTDISTIEITTSQNYYPHRTPRSYVVYFQTTDDGKTLNDFNSNIDENTSVSYAAIGSIKAFDSNAFDSLYQTVINRNNHNYGYNWYLQYYDEDGVLQEGLRVTTGIYSNVAFLKKYVVDERGYGYIILKGYPKDADDNSDEGSDEGSDDSDGGSDGTDGTGEAGEVSSDGFSQEEDIPDEF